MRKTNRWLVRASAAVFAGMLLLGSAPTASAQRRIIVVQPAPVFFPGPYWWGPYPYAYPGDYLSAHYGFVKIDKHHQDKNDSVYIDGGYAAKLKDAGKFALKPGNHDVELRDRSGHRIYEERVAVVIGKTTKVDIPS